MNRQELEQRQIKVKSKEDPGLTPEEISRTIPPLSKLVEDIGVKEVIWLDRVSSRGDSKKKMANRAATAKMRLERRGIKIFRCYGDQCSGFLNKLDSRTGLKNAIKESRKRQIPIVIPTISRLARNERYNTISNPSANITRIDLEEVIRFLDGVKVATLADESVFPQQEEMYLAEMSMEATNTKKGVKKRKSVGYKKRQREEWKNYSVELFNSGKSYRQIAKRISSTSGFPITHVTVRNWISNGKKTLETL